MQIVGHQSTPESPVTMDTSLAIRHTIMNPFLKGPLALPRGNAGSRMSPTLSNRSGQEDEEIEVTNGAPSGLAKQPPKAAKGQSSGAPLQKYQCPLCRETLVSQKEFTQHIRGHNEVKPHPDPNDPTGQAKVYYCCLCGKMLSSFSSLDRHMLVHSGERPFSCSLCGQTFTTNGNMHRHKRTHGTRDSHESDASSGGGSSGSAKRVRRTPKGGNVLKEQVRTMPSSSPESDVPVSLIPSKKYTPEPKDLLQLQINAAAGKKCPLCAENFFSEISLEAHIHTVHPGKVLKCDECPQEFPAYNFLKLHKNIYHHKSSLFTNYPSSLPALASMANLKTGHLEKEDKEMVVAGVPESSKLEEKPSKMVVDAAEKDPVPTNPNILDLSPLKGSKPAVVPELATSPHPLTPKSLEQCSNDTDQAFDESEGLLREMKLKGEFPCRLCPAVYPNLRALKGHNKEHMLKAPYECNVANCTYSSIDKGTLARHMRSHTGEKPFECKECNFGFTTKANCERHVKNKHGKSSRNEIRDSIVIHEVEPEDSFVSLTNKVLHDEAGFSPVKAAKKEEKKRGPKPQSSFFAPYRDSLFRPVPGEAGEEKPARLNAAGEAPLDLSKANLMESMKKADYEAKAAEFLMAREALTKQVTPQMAPSLPFLLQFQQLAAQQAVAAGNFDLTAYLLAQQEVLRRQREAAAAAAAAAAVKADPTTNFLLHLSSLQSNLASPASSASSTLSPSSLVSNMAPHQSPALPANSSASAHDAEEQNGDCKMVIKNGVLMKKHKQRRYRTERPYGCDLCNAKFTLRSNMERHIKQQHPENFARLKELALQQGRILEVKDDSEIEEDEDEEEIDPVTEDVSRDDDMGGAELSVDKVNSGLSSSHEDSDHGYLDNEDELSSDPEGKKSAYTNAPNRLPCPHCERKFPWASSLQRHVLTHTGDKPYKCTDCSLYFATKSNCDRHLMRKHGDNNNEKEVKQSPERPFKCPQCPSSTFSSEMKLRQHQYSKHFHGVEYQADDEARSNDDDEEPLTSSSSTGRNRESTGSNTSQGSTSDCPFKCHLCDEGSALRADAIEHLKVAHPSEYESLVAKRAFDAALTSDTTTTTTLSMAANPTGDESHPATADETFDQIRGRFPDYVNRKVMCVFCLRKFWSAEDLRRHVRTHTGERPYSCDICHRRFTLKHSMLRHRKKHDSGVSSGADGSESDSDSHYTASNSSPGDVRSSSPEDAQQRVTQNAMAAAVVLTPKNLTTDPKKKRANLMDKIKQLSTAVAEEEVKSSLDDILQK